MSAQGDISFGALRTRNSGGSPPLPNPPPRGRGDKKNSERASSYPLHSLSGSCVVAPLPDAMRPLGAHMRIHTGVDYGALLRFTMLDARQYRSPQPCPPLGRGGSTTIEECAARLDEQARLLGAQQMQVELRGLDDVTQADTACRSLASLVVEDGCAGAQRA